MFYLIPYSNFLISVASTSGRVTLVNKKYSMGKQNSYYKHNPGGIGRSKEK